MSLYFVEDESSKVWACSPAGREREWQLERPAPRQRARKGAQVLRFLAEARAGSRARGWVVEDLAPDGQIGDVIGEPAPEEGAAMELAEDPTCPPLGAWLLSGRRHTLTSEAPEPRPLHVPLTVEVAFAAAQYSEAGNTGRLELTLRRVPASDEALEELLGRLAEVAHSLAERPGVILFIRIDAREAAAPSLRHLMRLRAFLTELSPELAGVGRGCCIVVRTSGKRGALRRATAHAIQRALPMPWPRRIVSGLEEADAFLAHLEAESQSDKAVTPPQPPSSADTPIALLGPRALEGQEEALGRTLLGLHGMSEAVTCPGERKVVHEAAPDAGAHQGPRKAATISEAVPAAPSRAPPAIPDQEVPEGSLRLSPPLRPRLRPDFELEVVDRCPLISSESFDATPSTTGGEGGNCPGSWLAQPISPTSPGRWEKKDALLLDAWRRKLDARVRPQEFMSPVSSLPRYGEEGPDMEQVQQAPGNFLFCSCQCVKVEQANPVT